MTDDKTRAKAMNKAVQFTGKKPCHKRIQIYIGFKHFMRWFIGVSAVEIKGDHRNQIEVTGNEVDMIGLTKKLREKVAFAELVSVTKVEPPKKPEEKKEGDKKDGGDKKPPEKKDMPCYPCPQGYGVPSAFPYPCNPHDYVGEPVYNREPNCTIL